MAEEQQIRRHPRTRITLENCLRMAFLPTGTRQFMEGLNYELRRGPIQSQINLEVAAAYDIAKYLPFVALAYDLLK